MKENFSFIEQTVYLPKSLFMIVPCSSFIFPLLSKNLALLIIGPWKFHYTQVRATWTFILASISIGRHITSDKSLLFIRLHLIQVLKRFADHVVLSLYLEPVTASLWSQWLPQTSIQILSPLFGAPYSFCFLLKVQCSSYLEQALEQFAKQARSQSFVLQVLITRKKWKRWNRAIMTMLIWVPWTLDFFYLTKQTQFPNETDHSSFSNLFDSLHQSIFQSPA